MARDIVFVNPPYERIAPGYDFVRHVTNRAPSLGLLHLAAMAREHGWTPTIVESDVEGLDEAAVVRRIVERAPRYVGITLFTVGVWSAATIARGVKASLPGVTVLVGGPHVSSMGRETLERFDCFDVAVSGEGDWALIELLDALEAGADLSPIGGVLWRDGEKVHENPTRPIPKTLDDIAATDLEVGIRGSHDAEVKSPGWAPDGISIHELDRAYQRLLFAFYFRPKIAHHYIALSLRYPAHLRRLLRFGSGYARAKLRSLVSGKRGILVQEAESLR